MSIKLQNTVIEDNVSLIGSNEFSFASGLRMYMLDSQTGKYEQVKTYDIEKVLFIDDWNSGILINKNIFVKLLDDDGEEIQIDQFTNEYEAISTISIINQNKQQLQRISGSSTKEYNY